MPVFTILIHPPEPPTSSFVVLRKTTFLPSDRTLYNRKVVREKRLQFYFDTISQFITNSVASTKRLLIKWHKLDENKTSAIMEINNLE